MGFSCCERDREIKWSAITVLHVAFKHTRAAHAFHGLTCMVITEDLKNFCYAPQNTQTMHMRPTKFRVQNNTNALQERVFATNFNILSKCQTHILHLYIEHSRLLLIIRMNLSTNCLTNLELFEEISNLKPP